MTRRLGALFVNQGSGASAVMGHLRLESTLRSALEAQPALEARFVRLPPLRGLPAQLVRPVPGLAGLDLDLQPVRWHVVQAVRARNLVARELDPAVDVLHVHSHVLGMGLASVMADVPTALSVDAPVWEHHAMGIWRRVRSHSRLAISGSVALERRALAAAALVLAWSPWAAQAVERVCPTATIVEHHPGIDTDVFAPRPRVSQAVPRVLFVGNRFEQKGGADVMAALSRELERGDVTFDAVTESAVPPATGVTVHRLSPDDPALVRLYQQADVFAFPSHADASPWVVLEAMSCGTPVVGSTVGGIPDLVGDTGWVVPPGDVGALRSTLREAVSDESTRRRLGDRARQRVVDRFDADRNTAALVGLLRGIAG